MHSYADDDDEGNAGDDDVIFICIHYVYIHRVVINVTASAH